MSNLYPAVAEMADSRDTAFINSAMFNWHFGFGYSPLYVEYNAEWDTLYNNGFISKEEYPNNPFPM